MILGIVGPTAIGKSNYALKLAQNSDYIIINADSQQLYKELPILSAIPENLENHSLYGILDHTQKITVTQWVKFVNKEVQSALKLNKKIFIVGGTGLYFKVLQDGIVNLPNIKKETLDEVESYSFEKTIELLQKYDPQVLIKFKDERRLKKALAIYIQEKKSLLEFFAQKRKKVFDYDIKIEKMILNRENIRKNILIRLEKNFEKMMHELILFIQISHFIMPLIVQIM